MQFVPINTILSEVEVKRKFAELDFWKWEMLERKNEFLKNKIWEIEKELDLLIIDWR